MGLKNLSAVVMGAGWAGEGHVRALQANGVEVAAICARDPKNTERVAQQLHVPLASTDWRKTLAEIRPQIVALATPASLRLEVVEEAVKFGTHILCEKPLAADAGTAQQIYERVTQAGVKHAFCLNHLYDPSFSWVTELIRNGEIGTLREIQCLQVMPYANPLTPWSWMDVRASGGGLLNSVVVHLFSMIEKVIGGHLLRVTGEARAPRSRAPFVPGLHDYRLVPSYKLTQEEADQLEWRAADADVAVSALIECSSAGDPSKPVQTILHSNLAHPFLAPTNGWYFYGDKGTLVGKGFFSLSVFRQNGESLEELPIPQHLLPQQSTGDGGQDKWNALVADFVADIRGKSTRSYPTMYDGWRYQVALDAIANSEGWRVVPS